MKEWKKNYLRQFAIAMTVYVLFVILSTTVLGLGNVQSMSMQVVVALLPALPFAAIIYVIIKNVRELDELERKIHFEAILTAALTTGFISFCWGFLELIMAVPKMPAFVWAPLMIAVWGIANAILRRQYMGGDDE